MRARRRLCTARQRGQGCDAHRRAGVRQQFQGRGGVEMDRFATHHSAGLSAEQAVLGDGVAVTKDGCEVLTCTARELFSVPA